jgi:hypothetical protein
MALQTLVGPWPILQFRNPIYYRQDSLDVGSARRKRLLSIHRIQNKRTQTFIPRVGFESRAKAVHVSAITASEIGKLSVPQTRNYSFCFNTIEGISPRCLNRDDNPLSWHFLLQFPAEVSALRSKQRDEDGLCFSRGRSFTFSRPAVRFPW